MASAGGVLRAEVRRHSMRVGGESELSPFGRLLAESLAMNIARFDVVLSSTEQRAIETAQLIAGRVDRSMNDLNPVDRQLANVGHESSYEAFDRDPSLRRIASSLLASLDDELARATGRALIITHAGVIQALASAIRPRRVPLEGAAPGWCEGILIERNRTREWVVVELLRVDPDTVTANAVG